MPPTLILNEPLDGSTHRNGKVLFTGTASDPYVGVQGSDIQQIWFNITGPNDYFSHLYTQGQTAWEYQWNFEDLPSGEYTFEVWAAIPTSASTGLTAATWSVAPSSSRTTTHHPS